MGGTFYEQNSRSLRSADRGYTTKSASELFAKNLHESLNPMNLRFREARDSEAHPKSLPVIIGLDVTGSMGKIPHNLIQSGLPTMMATLLERGLNDAAVCFIAIGDHKSDKAPIQISQFESGDLELDTHLENTWLEGNGGGNNGESYFLAWYFAARKTKTDAWEKRKAKGFLFTIGDEHCHAEIEASSSSNRHNLTSIFGDGSEGTVKAIDLLKEAQEKYHVFHLNLATQEDIQNTWRSILGENNIRVNDYTEIPKIIAAKILEFADPASGDDRTTAQPGEVKDDEDFETEDKVKNETKITL